MPTLISLEQGYESYAFFIPYSKVTNPVPTLISLQQGYQSYAYFISYSKVTNPYFNP